MTKKKLTPEEEKSLKLLKANYEMLNNTREEVKLRGNEESLPRINIAIQDVIEEIKKIDKKYAEKLNENENNSSETYKKDEKEVTFNKNEDNATLFDKIEELEKDNKIVNDTDYIINNTDMQYDIIPLPSNGECYKSKIERLPVGYLTAYDENVITSPNLYRDGLVIDFLLKNKILLKDFNVDDLCSGDADAVILFLRATSYGSEFPILAKDPTTGQEIESTIDLSELKYKEFKLQGDENGYFDFELPVSHDNIKFKFLTRKDEKKLKMISLMEFENSKAKIVKENIDFLNDALKNDKILNKDEKIEYSSYLKKMTNWITKLSESNTTNYSKIITNRLEMSIVSVNGETDKDYISKYVRNMIAKDSLSLRRYITDNEPGINFEITVKRPESLGGGSFKTFLEWDDSIFLNIA